ncbi:DUF4198 domain-containing protein [Aeromonas sobria]|uniref:Nickel transporter n=1 Tax=Aeromonas sobria TaxID=646 RepID=A0A1S2CV74_AERSO|nr:DUF4198 domain-containing protein [Aeromonas sobria]MBS4686175.1 DUF4198 domain-containing protein [Aeromonas sobria]OHY91917.1 hypothetical protein BJD16_15030 [Aeromonas sobria]
MINRSFGWGLLALVATSASAHPVWMLPSEFNVSSDTAHWVTVDGTASHGVFSFDKPIGLDNVTVYDPAGNPARIGPYYKGQRRSVFDLALSEVGTYKVELRNPPRYVTTYTIGKRNTERRIMANKHEATAQVPTKAQGVTTYAMQNISAFYVTRNTPSDTVLKSSGQGLELQPLTHPSDVVVGEAARFRLTFDGQPLAERKVEVVGHGTQWRDGRQQQDLVSDQDGVVAFTPAQRGPHLLSANIEQVSRSPLADKVEINYLLTFEVLPQ